jgi:undecaprenyl-diphosphatase
VNEGANRSLRTAFDIVTSLGGVIVLSLLSAAVGVWLLRRRAFSEAALLVGVVVGIQVLNPLLKLAFERPRPELSRADSASSSFPSGHAASSTAIYGLLLLLIVSRSGRRARIAGALTWVCLATAIGFSRVYIGAHYLSDILAGISLATAWLALCLLVFVAVRRRRPSGTLP